MASCDHKPWLLGIFTLCALCLVFCYPWAHYESGRINAEEHTWNLITINMSSMYTNTEQCNILVTNNSAHVLRKYFDDPDDLIMYLSIAFDSKSSVDKSSDEDVVLPLRWIWTYGKGLDYLDWPEEYFIWSFGLLTSDTPDIPVTFTAYPPNCTVHYGRRNTTFMMAYALSQMAEQYLKVKAKHYRGSTWCYTTVVKEKHADTFIRNFGYFVGQFGYRCCNVSDENAVTCFDKAKRPNQLYTTIPFYVAFFALLISPLLYSFLIEWTWPLNAVCLVKQTKQRQDYINIDDDKWLFLENKSPISFFSCITSFLGNLCFPQSFCKIVAKAVVLGLIFPGLIYAKLILYTFADHVSAYLDDKIKHNLPVGFSSMLFSVKSQSANFLTLTGGPFVMLTIVFLIWLVFLIVEELKISKDEDTKQRAANLVCLNDASTESVCDTIKNNTITVFQKSTWVQAWSTVSKPEAVFNIFKHALFNVIPLVFAFRFITARIICVRTGNGFLSVFLTLLTLTACCYSLFAYCAIFIASFESLTLIAMFLYMSVVKYPDVTGGYIALIIGLVYIIISSLRYPAHKYLRFLQMVIESLKYVANVEVACEIRNETLDLIYFNPNQIKQYAQFDDDDGNRTECVLVRNTLVVRSRQNIEYFRINDIYVNLTRNETMKDHPPPKPYLKYKDGKLAIDNELFMKLVHELKPIKKSIALAIVKTLMSVLFLILTAVLVKQMHQVVHISSISNVVTAYIVVKIPQLINIIVKDTDPEIKKDILKEKIKYETFKYTKGETEGRPDDERGSE
ncbi:uncharacterized protein LOC121380936 [Gigantopelta aegis]|uniref:uncharacterized protein LOC121380936 n=1 Tax=Gigantopelta aegis TaxID=1735272 RepID=UPI001B88D88D|nr:uncharacterized protein LOC121380936 [Gigantopelta aegis]